MWLFSKRKLPICCAASLFESLILLINVFQLTVYLSRLALGKKIPDRNNNSTVTEYCFYFFGLPFKSLSCSQCTLVRETISKCQCVTLKKFTSLKIGLEVYRRGTICIVLFPATVFFQITYLSCCYLPEAI